LHRQRALQFLERHIRLGVDRVPQQRQLRGLQPGDRPPAVPRGQVLPGPMPAQHLFDEGGTDPKPRTNCRNRPLPGFDRVHHPDP
jgi:hypothetical protein